MTQIKKQGKTKGTRGYSHMATTIKNQVKLYTKAARGGVL